MNNECCYRKSLWNVKVKVRTLDITPLRESSPQKRSFTARRSCMARVLKGSHRNRFVMLE